MELTLKERGSLIIQFCKESKIINPVEMFEEIARQNFIRIHGPEHHVLNGAVFLTAFYNAGGKINLAESLEELMTRGLQMPGATCGKWGVCGAVTSIGAALSIVDGTSPLSIDDNWGNHMKYTSKTLNDLADIGGPRCCKRHAFLVFESAVEYAKNHYNITFEYKRPVCKFAEFNQQCIEVRCPFYGL